MEDVVRVISKAIIISMVIVSDSLIKGALSVSQTAYIINSHGCWTHCSSSPSPSCFSPSLWGINRLLFDDGRKESPVLSVRTEM